jgi:hypothetical protein
LLEDEVASAKKAEELAEYKLIQKNDEKECDLI